MAVGIIDASQFLALTFDLDNSDSIEKSAYSATKAAIAAAFTEVLALDGKEFGIKVDIIESSGFRTNFPEVHRCSEHCSLA